MQILHHKITHDGIFLTDYDFFIELLPAEVRWKLANLKQISNQFQTDSVTEIHTGIYKIARCSRIFYYSFIAIRKNLQEKYKLSKKMAGYVQDPKILFALFKVLV